MSRPQGSRNRLVSLTYDTIADKGRSEARETAPVLPVDEPLCRRDDESEGKWQERLTDKQRAELDQWQSDHRWSPNRLRHSAGTEIRKHYGLEAAQVILGHASADVTQVYAERDLQKAVEIMREVG